MPIELLSLQLNGHITGCLFLLENAYASPNVRMVSTKKLVKSLIPPFQGVVCANVDPSQWHTTSPLKNLSVIFFPSILHAHIFLNTVNTQYWLIFYSANHRFGDYVMRHWSIVGAELQIIVELQIELANWLNFISLHHHPSQWNVYFPPRD